MAGMNLSLKRKIIFYILAVSIVFTPVFSILSIINSFDPNLNHVHHHDCEHSKNNAEDDICCPICLKIETANNYLKTLRSSNIFFVIPAFSMNHTQLIKSEYYVINSYCISPILLKVRINC